MLDVLDRTAARTVVSGTFTSACGIIGTLILIGISLWLYVPFIKFYFQGIYFQSFFQVQQTPSSQVLIPSDFRAAIVFRNNTDNSVANHTMLKEFSIFQTFLIQSGQFVGFDRVQACNRQYFADTINPILLADCFLFTANSRVNFSYSSNLPSSFGFQPNFYCDNPFLCKSGTQYYTNASNSYRDFISNFSFTLYFTSRVIAADGTMKDQLFSVFSSEWNTPFTVSSQVGAELELMSTMMDNSILPWLSNVVLKTTLFKGVAKGKEITKSSYLAVPPLAYFYNARYQNYGFRHYLKADLLLGIIGGGIFLLYLFVFIPCHYVNSCLFHIQTANELLIEHPERQEIASVSRLKEVKISKCYILKRLFPSCFQSEQILQFKRVMDIGDIIKKLKVADKNFRLNGVPTYNRILELDLSSSSRTEESGQLLNHNHLNQQSRQEYSRQPKQLIQQQLQQQLPSPQRRKQETNLPTSGLLPPSSMTSFGNLEKPIQVQHERVNLDQLEEDSRKLNMNIQTVEAIETKRELIKLAGVQLTIQAICNNSLKYREKVDDLSYYRDGRFNERREGVLSRFIGASSDFFRLFDAFGVRPQFTLSPAASSYCGCVISFLVVGLVILFVIVTLINYDNYQVMTSQVFQQPSEINYSVKTGDAFRPFLCFNSNSAAVKITQTVPTINLTFYSQTASGKTQIPWVNLQSNKHSYLGVSSDSPYYYNFLTENCFIMKDDYTLNMGGFGTSSQASFGFNISPYCSGTDAYCQSIASSLKSTLSTFLSTYSMTFYLPINSYDPMKKSVYGGGVFPQVIKESTSFTLSSGLEEMYYLDQIQLLDSYSKRYKGQSPPVLQQTFTLNRYQQGPAIKTITSVIPYYSVRFRPSGRLTKVILQGYTLDILLGIIGGLFVIFWGLFHWLGKSYNHYNVRSRLAQELYGRQQYEQGSFWEKICAIFLPLCVLREGKFKQQVSSMKMVDEKIISELYPLDVIKDVNMIALFSSTELQDVLGRQCSLIYFKQRLQLSSEEEDKNKESGQQKQIGQKGENQFIGEDYEDQQSNKDSQNKKSGSSNRVQNQAVLAEKDKTGSKQEVNDPDIDRMAQDYRRMTDRIPLTEPNRGPSGLRRSNIFSFFDWFSTKPEFSLNGQWRIKSVWGGLVTLALIACILVMNVYSVAIYNRNHNETISHDQRIESNAATAAPFELNSSNYRLAVGFLTRPSTDYKNVASLVNQGVGIGIRQVTITRDSNGFMAKNQTLIALEPCASNYFDSFQQNKNVDYGFLGGLIYGYCLPLNSSLLLSSIAANPLNYLTLRVYNTSSSSTSTTALKNLTKFYVLGLLMTVPVIDMSSKSFIYTVQSIRGYPNPIIRAFEMNLTLTKQRIIFTTPNYTLFPAEKTIETYNYLFNTNNERQVLNSDSTAPFQFNVTMSYQGLLDEYTVRQQHFGKPFGIVGGLIALYFCLGAFLVQSFNTFKMKYLLAKNLYLPYVIDGNRGRRRRNKKKSKIIEEREIEVNERYIEFDESDLFLMWLSSRFGGLFNRCGCNKNLKILMKIFEKVEKDLNINTFFKKYRILKETVNRRYQIHSNSQILATNLFAKLPFVFPRQNYPLQRILPEHGLSCYEQNKLRQLFQKEVNLQAIFDDQKVKAQIRLNVIRHSEGVEVHRQDANAENNNLRQIKTVQQTEKLQEDKQNKENIELLQPVIESSNLNKEEIKLKKEEVERKQVQVFEQKNKGSGGSQQLDFEYIQNRQSLLDSANKLVESKQPSKPSQKSSQRQQNS